jgi:hypothetical protein
LNVSAIDSTASIDAPAGVPPEVLGTLAKLLREVRYGSIEIVVHEGRVTQIERREKVRFAPAEPRR